MYLWLCQGSSNNKGFANADIIGNAIYFNGHHKNAVYTCFHLFSPH